MALAYSIRHRLALYIGLLVNTGVLVAQMYGPGGQHDLPAYTCNFKIETSKFTRNDL